MVEQTKNCTNVLQQHKVVREDECSRLEDLKFEKETYNRLVSNQLDQRVTSGRDSLLSEMNLNICHTESQN